MGILINEVKTKDLRRTKKKTKTGTNCRTLKLDTFLITLANDIIMSQVLFVTFLNHCSIFGVSVRDNRTFGHNAH